jgi:hypothetical protein
MKMKWTEVENMYGDMEQMGAHRDGGARCTLEPFLGPIVSVWVSVNGTEAEGKKIAEAGFRAMRKEMKRLKVEACAFPDGPEDQPSPGGG